jgi:integrase
VQWRHVDFKNDKLLITGGEKGAKNMKQRLIPLFTPLKNLLLTMSEGQTTTPTEHLFTHFSSKTALINASKAIGLPNGEHFTHHDMRHFFCSNLIEKNIPDHVIAAWLGHSDGGILVKTTYGHLRKGFSDDMAKLVTFEV